MGNSPGVWEAAPTACAVVICFASCIGSINRLECEHRRKVCSVSGDVMLSRTGDATSICAITAPHSLPFALPRSEEHTSELQSHSDLVCRLLLEKKKKKKKNKHHRKL